MGPPEQEYPPRGHPEHWRAYLTLPVHEFFGYWKEQYRSLAWVVVPDDDQGVLCGNESSTNVSICILAQWVNNGADDRLCRRFEIFIVSMVGHSLFDARNARKLY